LVGDPDLEAEFLDEPEAVMRRPEWDFSNDTIDTVLNKPLRELKSAIEREVEGDTDAASKVYAFRVKMG
jgi:hypothetical protein